MNQTPPRRGFLSRLNRTKNQTLLVAIVGIIVALAFFLASMFTGSGSGLFPGSGWFPGLGSNGNGTSSTGNESDNTVSTEAPEEIDKPQSLAPTPTPETQAPAPILDQVGDVLFLRIGEKGYEVRRTVNRKSTWHPATLQDIVALARQSDGDDKGIKVIMEVSWNATSANEAELQTLLTTPIAKGGAGLDNNSIMKRKDYE